MSSPPVRLFERRKDFCAVVRRPGDAQCEGFPSLILPSRVFAAATGLGYGVRSHRSARWNLQARPGLHPQPPRGSRTGQRLSACITPRCQQYLWRAPSNARELGPDFGSCTREVFFMREVTFEVGPSCRPSRHPMGRRRLYPPTVPGPGSFLFSPYGTSKVLPSTRWRFRLGLGFDGHARFLHTGPVRPYITYRYIPPLLIT